MKKGKPYKSLYLPALTIVAAVLALLVVIAVSTYRNLGREREKIEDSLRREGLRILRAVEAGVRVDLSSREPDLLRLQRLMQEMAREPGIARIVLFDARGNLLAAAGPRPVAERIRDAFSLDLLLKEKGVITRTLQPEGMGRVLEVIKPFRPFSARDPLALRREAEGRMEGEGPGAQWYRDKMISIGLRRGSLESAWQADLHHAILMGAILIVLGTGAVYFISIVKNYYLVDRSLAQMKTYTENVVESMADGLISVDNQRRIVTLNRRAREILESAEEEWKGREVSALLGPNVEALLLPGGRGGDQELELVPRSGLQVVLSLSAAPLRDETGREMGSVLLLRDLREIRGLQEEVRRSERLAALGRLAAGMAHEIRNPLSSIRGFAQYFQKLLQGRAEEQGYAAVMIKEVDRLNRVIAELLDFARPKKLRRETHSMVEILEHALALLQPELARKKVEIDRAYPPGLSEMAVDRDQLAQAFLNLLLNALDSMDGAGRVRIGIRESGSAVEVSISDTGRGIPPEDLGKVFEPFFSTKTKGAGLGLAIVHQIVESHGGEIGVESRESAGTTFRLTLPVGAAARPLPLAAEQEKA